MELAGNIGERNVYRPDQLKRATDLIADRFRNLGYEVEFQAVEAKAKDYRLGSEKWAEVAYNVIARFSEDVARNDPKREIIVLGAHYDTLAFTDQWVGTDQHRFRPNERGTRGANDNATGVAALLEIARQLKTARLDREVRFAAFVNEEPPFFQQRDAMGSFQYAQRCRIANQEIVMMISLDALGLYTREGPRAKRGWLRSWFATRANLPFESEYVAFMSNRERGSGAQAVEWAREFARRSPVAVRTLNLPFFPALGTEYFAWSDDWSFTRFDYPAFTITDTAFYRSDRYHERWDTPEFISARDYELFSGVVVGVADMVRTMADPNVSKVRIHLAANPSR